MENSVATNNLEAPKCNNNQTEFKQDYEVSEANISNGEKVVDTNEENTAND